MKAVSGNDDELGRAVRDLRRALNEPQGEFAHRLGYSVRTVTRHEGGDVPDDALTKYLQIAIAHDQHELAEKFRRALGEDAAQLNNLNRVLRKDESEIVDAFLQIIRAPGGGDDQNAILAILQPHIERAQRHKAKSAATASAVSVIRTRAAAGDSDEEIIKAFPVFSPKFIRTEAADERERIRLAGMSATLSGSDLPDTFRRVFKVKEPKP